jgi:cellulose synthase/poly-beta-1,6-N-acetylglucosamine synthase-like glycosyltransferase/spore germination protein YaaH/peptidoglycan/xylan/chitin deacetylase (PgdA/CDA1 family)
MIFTDLSKKRWFYAKIIFGLIIFLAVILLGAVVAGFIINPPLPQWQENKTNQLKYWQVSSEILKQETAQAVGKKSSGGIIRRRSNSGVISNNTTPGINTANTSSSLLSAAFLEQDDQASIDSFVKNKAAINLVFPDWYAIKSNGCDIINQENSDVTKIITQAPGVKIIPRLTNSFGGQWAGSETSKLLASATISQCVAGKIAGLLKNSPAAGINIDFEDLSPEDKDNFLEFIDDLDAALHPLGKTVTVDVTANDPAYDLEYLGHAADLVVMMAYDEHYPGGEAGPIASRDWFEGVVDDGVAAIPKEKLIIGLGIYGYDWTMGSKSPASGLKFSEVMSLAQDAGVDLELKSDYGYNLYFGYQDDKNQKHQVWFLNGLTAWNEFLYSRDSKVAGVALWRLGAEDPTYWKIFNSKTSAQDFIEVPALNNVDYSSNGELFKITDFPQAGKINLTTDTDGSIDYAIYDKLPSGYTVGAVGKPFPPKSLALTFDDGPDKTWTPQIIKILKENNVPATFFIVGQQAQMNPGVLNLLKQGNFLVGNHTYLHPDLNSISGHRLRLEVNETTRVIETVLQRKTILFRPPYNTDSTPTTPEELSRLAVVNRLNYIISGANIDSEDWQKPGVDKIIQNVLSLAANPENHVIVMHDAGGDRSQTVAALKKLIPLLKSQGYYFVSLDQGSGISAKVLNPPLAKSELLLVYLNSIWLFITRWFWFVIFWLFLVTTVIAIARILFLGAIIIRSAKHKMKTPDTPVDFPVSIIIPAYNEEKVIAKTILALQKSTYKNWEALVVNDGSTDGTPAEVEKLIAGEPRLKLINKANGGKSSALNIGFEKARSEVVVTIDGDTIFKPDTLLELIRPMADKKVDAVCGNVEVGNVKNILTGFQSLEYITSQNFDRRAFDELNCISVVPGATGAWRRSSVIAAGGYSDDTLTEDADLTLRMLSLGARIVYAPEARSLTEAPETVRALAKQRFRWSFGTFQCLWKNRRIFGHGNLGRIGLPNMFFFQVIFPLLSPIGDLVLILSIFRGDLRAVALGYILFTMMDVCGSLLAFVLEKRPKKLMWLILIQRFFYRQFMYYITYKSIIAMIRGRSHGWNKLQRTGNVILQK